MSVHPPIYRRINRRGFTLVELLVAMTILVLVLILAAQMIAATSKLWKNTTSKIEAFQAARDGFQLMTDELRQATVNTYWDYFTAKGQTIAQWNISNLSGTSIDGNASFIPAAYGRQSELHFISGPSLLTNQVAKTHAVFFQIPLGFTANTVTYGSLQNLLTATGFFIEFSDGSNCVNSPASFLTTSRLYRYRLMQFIQPTEQLAVYDAATFNSYGESGWFQIPIQVNHASTVHIVANNIIGLIIWPKKTDTGTDTLGGTDTPLSPTYSFDSRTGYNATGTAISATSWTPGGTTIPTQPLQTNQMPPILRVAMIAIDEPSAKVLQGSATTAPTQIATAFGQTNPSTGQVLFTTAVNMDSDLLYLQTGPSGLAAITPHLNFRVFDTTIIVRSARFSTN